MPLNESKGNMYNWKLPDIEDLKKLYFENELSASDIAKKYNVTKGAVLIKFRRYNVKRRTLSEAQNLNANHINLTKNMIDFIDGLLLGDGSITITPEMKSAVYSHTDKNKEYLEWLVVEFKKFDIKCSKISQRKDTLCFSIKTKNYREFILFRNKWYPNGEKLIPNIILTPIILFNWYIGDGSYQKYTTRETGREKVVICSQFDNKGKEKLSKQMDLLGIKNSIYPDCIYIKSESKKLFFNYIKNHDHSIPICYNYKFKNYGNK